MFKNGFDLLLTGFEFQTRITFPFFSCSFLSSSSTSGRHHDPSSFNNHPALHLLHPTRFPPLAIADSPRLHLSCPYPVHLSPPSSSQLPLPWSSPPTSPPCIFSTLLLPSPAAPPLPFTKQIPLLLLVLPLLRATPHSSPGGGKGEGRRQGRVRGGEKVGDEEGRRGGDEGGEGGGEVEGEKGRDEGGEEKGG